MSRVDRFLSRSGVDLSVVASEVQYAVQEWRLFMAWTGWYDSAMAIHMRRHPSLYIFAFSLLSVHHLSKDFSFGDFLTSVSIFFRLFLKHGAPFLEPLLWTLNWLFEIVCRSFWPSFLFGA